MINIDTLLVQLASRRPIFHSEADFQHALAWLLHEEFPTADLRLEFPIKTALGTLHADVMMNFGGRTYVWELKYKTHALEVVLNGEEFQLQDHVALPLGRYDFLKDVQRIESVVAMGPQYSGAAILLTNDSAYWGSPRSLSDTSAAFSLAEGRTVSGVLDWSEKTSDGTKRNREKSIGLSGAYKFNWADYSTMKSGAYSRFRFLLVAVG